MYMHMNNTYVHAHVYTKGFMYIHAHMCYITRNINGGREWFLRCIKCIKMWVWQIYAVSW